MTASSRRCSPATSSHCTTDAPGGTALANVLAALGYGVTTFDASGGGLGGCHFAPGAAGNLATEDLVYFLDASGWETGGVSLDGVLTAARFIADAFNRSPHADTVRTQRRTSPST